MPIQFPTSLYSGARLVPNLLDIYSFQYFIWCDHCKPVHVRSTTSFRSCLPHNPISSRDPQLRFVSPIYIFSSTGRLYRSWLGQLPGHMLIHSRPVHAFRKFSYFLENKNTRSDFQISITTEYHDISSAYSKIIWLVGLLKELGIKVSSTFIPFHENNTSAI